MKVRIAFIVTALSGFVALSYEIVWVRIYGFLTEGEAESFGLLLSAYLAGLALGGLLVDDGRRFLSRTTESFDIIISNTTVYWRAHAANLLSREYFELVGRRLNPGGIVYANSTQSAAVHKAMATVFPYAWRYQNMVLAGFDPIRLDFDRWRVELSEWTIRGTPVFDPVADDGLIDQLSVERTWRGGPTWESREQILSRTRRGPIMTDDNMATEWWAWETFPSGDE